MNANQLRRRTFDFAAACVTFCRHLPPEWEARELGRQLLKSGTSVAANYRSACRGRSRKEFAAKLGIVVEEADETVTWLELLECTHIVGSGSVSPLLREAEELLAIVSRSHRTAKDNLRILE
jgi:four helix bundle protein